jgi:hypothetical protein
MATEYIVDLEPIAHCMRVLIKGETVGRGTYKMAATAHWLDRRTVELKGTTSREKEPDNNDNSESAQEARTRFIAMRSAVCEAFAAMGAETVIWTRNREGRPDSKIYMDTKTHRVKR